MKTSSIAFVLSLALSHFPALNLPSCCSLQELKQELLFPAQPCAALREQNQIPVGWEGWLSSVWARQAQPCLHNTQGRCQGTMQAAICLSPAPAWAFCCPFTQTGASEHKRQMKGWNKKGKLSAMVSQPSPPTLAPQQQMDLLLCLLTPHSSRAAASASLLFHPALFSLPFFPPPYVLSSIFSFWSLLFLKKADSMLKTCSTNSNHQCTATEVPCSA